MALVDEVLTKQRGAKPSFDELMGNAAPTGGGKKSFEELMGSSDPALAQEEAQAQAPLEQEAAPQDPNSWGSIIGRNVDQLQANGGGTLEAVGEAVGSEFLMDTGKQIREEQLAEAAEYGDPSHTSYKDVDMDDIGSVAAPVAGSMLTVRSAGGVESPRFSIVICATQSLTAFWAFFGLPT